MSSLKYAAIRGMFELLWASHLPALIRRLSTSKGVIFTLHRVLPEDPPDFSPNAILQVRPDFLEFTIQRVRELGLDPQMALATVAHQSRMGELALPYQLDGAAREEVANTLRAVSEALEASAAPVRKTA